MVTVTVTVTAVSHRHDSFSPFFTVLHMAFFMVTSPHFHRLFTVFSRYGDYFRLFENCSPRTSLVRDGMSGVLLCVTDVSLNIFRLTDASLMRH